ncbi:MAG TPA: EAL domain-containing protein [Polyangiaceae bacterium]|jgi:EAL domain-containing protein (putative c-di-GMP-specific phosphodiesterase class I)|nr:EAL domain-containing protein [Polyangiaceae bacterium]
MRALDRGNTPLPTDAVRVLVADDEQTTQRACARILSHAGYEVTACSDGSEAMQAIEGGHFDVILSDISMPHLDGIQLLRKVREHDRDVPVVLMTGAPRVETAISAVDFGAFKYLEKPVDSAELLETVGRAVKLHALARAKREALDLLGTGKGEGAERAALEASFERTLETLWIAFQPIVKATNLEIYGYEALLRSNESSLPHPEAVLDAAERLGQLERLGRAVRERAAAPMFDADPNWLLFLNLHPRDLDDPELLDPSTPTGRMARRIVLEVTERSSLDDVAHLREKVTELRRMGFRIAIDDLGAGYAGLSSFVNLEPDVVKLDISLVRNLHESRVKQKLVRSIAVVCRDTDMLLLAEGIELDAERDCAIELGCDLLQGYRFGRPSLPFIPASR